MSGGIFASTPDSTCRTINSQDGARDVGTCGITTLPEADEVVYVAMGTTLVVVRHASWSVDFGEAAAYAGVEGALLQRLEVHADAEH